MIKQKCWLLHVVMGLILAINANASASTHVDIEPYQVVDSTTRQVLELLKTGVDPVKQPEQFITSLSEVLDPVVAFNYIAKGVMGQYSKRVLPGQIERFIASFKTGLVSQYGEFISLYGFDGLTVVTLPPSQPVGTKRKTSVRQKITSAAGTVTNISYTMGKNSQGQWKILNLSVDGANLGQLLRGQFAAAVAKNNGDIDKTIMQWGQGIQ